MKFKFRLSNPQKIGLFAWLTTFITSVWATSSSLSNSFSVPIAVCIFIALAIIAAMSILLAVVKKHLSSNRIRVFPVIGISLIFTALWSFSILTNSHQFFLSLKGDDIARESISYCITELSDLGENQEELVETLIENYKNEGARKISDFYHEILNPNNRGVGFVSDSLTKEIAAYLGVEDFSSMSGRIPNRSRARTYAETMSKKMWDVLNHKVASFDDRFNILQSCKDPAEVSKIIEELQTLNNYSTNFYGADFKNKITEAHLFYQNSRNCFQNKLNGFSSNIEFPNNLEMPVPFVRLQKLDELIPFVISQPKQNPGRYMSAFIYCLVIAFLVDLAGLTVLYTVVLKEED